MEILNSFQKKLYGEKVRKFENNATGNQIYKNLEDSLWPICILKSSSDGGNISDLIYFPSVALIRAMR